MPIQTSEDPQFGELVRRLKAVATPQRAVNEKRYLKSDLEFLGATVPQTKKIALDVFGRRHDPAELLVLARRLWASEIFELRMSAVKLLTREAKTVTTAELDDLEFLLRRSHTWALVDELAVHVVGRVRTSEPAAADEVLDRWACDDDFWIRRSALLAHLSELSSGAGDFEKFTSYAQAMLGDKEFFIAKAVGWVLRATSKRRPELVAAWVGPRATDMQRLSLREATRLMPDELREPILRAAGIVSRGRA